MTIEELKYQIALGTLTPGQIAFDINHTTDHPINKLINNNSDALHHIRQILKNSYNNTHYGLPELLSEVYKALNIIGWDDVSKRT